MEESTVYDLQQGEIMTPEEISSQLSDIVNKAVEPLKTENLNLKRRVAELEAIEAPSISDEDIRGAVSAEVQKCLPTRDELKGDPGNPGADGIGVKGAFIDHDGRLTLTMDNGDVSQLGRVVAKDGKPGRDGADYTDCHVEYDGERSIKITSNGKTIVKRLPVPIWRGYYRDGNKSEAGDIWTHNGTAYIAVKDTNTAPSGKDRDTWGVLARRGDPGRDMRDQSPDDNPINVGGGNG